MLVQVSVCVPVSVRVNNHACFLACVHSSECSCLPVRIGSFTCVVRVCLCLCTCDIHACVLACVPASLHSFMIVLRVFVKYTENC